MRDFGEFAERGRGHGHGGGRRGFGRGFGGPGGWQQADLPPADDVDAWFAGRLPGEWFTSAPSIDTDREEITVVGEIAAPEYPANAEDAAKRTADAGRIGLFREETREARVRLSDEAEAR